VRRPPPHSPGTFALPGRIPDARFRVVPDAKHLVQEDAPEAIVATVLDFIREKR
jgi:pimeloyl-ACP methyl ester carboxylesterase